MRTRTSLIIVSLLSLLTVVFLPSATSASPIATSAPGVVQAKNDIHQMGGRPFTTLGGGILSISKPIAIAATPTGTGYLRGGHHWKATITFVNTAGIFAPEDVAITALANSTQCSSITDGEKYTPPAPIPVGKVSWAFAFSCRAPARANILAIFSYAGSDHVYTFAGKIPR